MRPNPSFVAGLLALSFACQASAQEDISEILSDPAINLDRPADRDRAMKRIEDIENARLQNARAKAKAMGLPLRMEKPGGGIKELIDFDGEQPVYLETKNLNAAISTTANLVRTSPYMLDGSGLTVGVWDAAGGRPTHVEFATGSRLTNMNGTATNYHSMHVAGTIAALGVDAPSRGMANAALINSYNWTNDISEMGTAGATAAGQTATKVYLSNHSYGTADGWDGNTWIGTGADQNAYDISFGQYSGSAQSMDSTAYSTPYLLSFWAAGNERSDNPATGSSVSIGGVTTTYNPTIHPPGDGKYRNGYETISYRNLAKNVVTVGAVNDAVTSGVRDLAKATISSFSSTGPTDDGRIKPDLVANGVGLRSTYDTNDTAYSSISGTSMATPNACGSATLLVDQYNRLFGSAMRASTLKALLIQTADDIGNPGPDYYFGWGLIDVKDAADLLIDHQANPTKKRLTEDQVSTSITSRTHSFTWDGVSPIKATIAWTDPAGTAVSSHDSRTPTLKNNLNLKLIAPNGTEYFPFVMPFVGTWTVASMSQNATTGINNTDNVEQVLVTNPGQTGSWQAVVSYSGTLTNSLQNYGLIISGSANENLPLAINSITPAGGTTGTTVTADITGTKLSADTAIRLRQAGRADIIGTSVQLINSTTLRCQLNLTGAASGLWNIVATNPDTETFTLPDAFTITGSLTTLWSQNFDGTVTGWTSQSTTGSNNWTVSTAQSHSPTKSYFAAGIDALSTTYLISPQIGIPSNLSNIQIEFWHNYDLQSAADGGRFSLSLDNGATWYDVTDVNSGAAFTSNGYNTTMATNGQISEYAGLQAWSGNSGGFIRTVVSLNDIPKYAGQNLRMRWGIATNPKTASTGWHVDSVALLSDSSTPNQAPQVSVAASTSSSETETVGPTVYQIIRGTGADLAVTATDDAGEPDLTYTWASSGPAPVSFNVNGNNSSKNSSVTFQAIGDHAITVTVTDTGGLTTTSTVNVRVLPTASLQVTPNPALVQIGASRQFSAILADQFGTALANQPSPINWTVSSGGSIDSSGIFSATTVGGPFEVTASSSPYSGIANVTVSPAPATVTLGNLNQTYDGNPKPVTVTTDPTLLSYAVTYNGLPDAPINVGTYEVNAIITDSNHEGSAAGSLVIEKASQTITFAPLAPVALGDAPFALAATASSGLTVSYASSNPSVATVSGNTVTIIGLGTTTLTASQAGNSNYNAAPGVPQQLSVVLANPVAYTGGPYKVLVNSTLALNGSASLASDGETITAYEWDLNNDNTFGDATGATPPAIGFATLTGTWGMVPGSNTIQLKVTDSAGKTSTASTAVELVLALTWDANGTSASQTNGAGAWLDANKWWDGSANVIWQSGSDAVFGGPNTSGGAVTLASPTMVNAITFNTFTGTYTLGTAGQTITLNSGINKTASSAAVSIISPITLGAGQTWTNNSSAALTASGNLDNGGYTIDVNGSGSTSLTGTISGAGGITKAGPGKLSFNNNNTNTYTGTTTINNGTLMMGNSTTSLGGGNLILNGGMLDFYYSAGLTRTLGPGANQVQILGGVSGFGGEANNQNPTVNLGTTIIWGASGEGSATGYFNPAKFALGSSVTTNTGTNTTFSSGINLNGANRTIFVNNGANGGVRATISGAISNSTGTAGLIKEGDGMLNLTNNSSAWNGPTSVQGGVLDFGGMTNANIGGGSGRNITMAAGTAVRFNVLSNTFLNRIVETSAAITVMTGTTSNNLNFGGSTGANLPDAFLGTWASNGAKCEISGTITPASDNYRLGSVRNNGLLGLTNTSPMTGTQGLIIGGGSVELVGPKTFTGDTVIRAGGRLGLAATASDGGVALGLQNSVLDVGSAGGNIWFESGGAAGPITGSVATTSAVFGGLKGSRDLASVYSTTTGANNSAATAVTAITGFTLNNGAGVNVTYSGNMGGFGTGGSSTLTKAGPGTQILSGTNTYTGATMINGGTLGLGTTGSIATSSSLDIGAGATLDTSGKSSHAIPASQPVTFGIDATGSGSSGKITANGLNITNAVVHYNFNGAPDDPAYVLVTYTALTGSSFAAVDATPAGYTLDYAYQGNKIALVQASGPGPVDHFDISAINSPQTAGVPITGITLTAKDSSNNTATSFTGTVTFGGTGGFSGTSASFVDGVLSGVSATPTVAGSNLTFTVTDGTHNGSVTIATIQTPYAAWSGGATFDADANGDGVKNGMAWALGAVDPSASALGLLPTIDNTSDADYFIYTYRRSDAAIAAGTTIAAQYGNTLSGWTTAAAGPDITIMPTDNFYGVGVDKVEVKIKRTLAVDGKLFTRLAVAP